MNIFNDDILCHTRTRFKFLANNLHTNMANRIFNCMLVKQIFNLCRNVAKRSANTPIQSPKIIS